MTQPLESAGVVDAEHRVISEAIVPVQASAVPVPRYFQDMRPAERIAYATEMADALKAIIDQKKLGHKLNSRNSDDEFVELEAWQTCGSLCGMSAKIEWVRPIDDGFEARAVIVRVDTGIEVGAAESRCTRSEGGNWGRAKDFALSGMASTRAQSRAFRGILAWILVLAGYKPTVAEEMPGYEPKPKPASSSPAAPPDTQDRDSDTPANRDHWRKQIAIGCENRGVSREQRQEIAEAFFSQYSMSEDPTKADQPNNSERLTAAQLHLLYKLLARMIGERNRQGDAFDFSAWLANARARYRAA